MYDIYDLKCDGMFNPMGITNAAPRFSWKLISDENNNEQKAYIPYPLQLLRCLVKLLKNNNFIYNPVQ